MIRLPDIDIPVFRTAHYIFAVVTETSLNLAAHVDVTFILAGDVQVAQVVEPDPAVVGGNQNFVFSGHRLDAAYLATGGVPSSGRSDVDLGVVFELVRYVEYTPAVVGADDSKFSVLAEIGGCY